MMGGMGRTFDGGYAEYTCVPAAQVIPFRSELHWATLGAVPEMLQTAYGSLTVGLDAQPGQTLLIRGGTSSVGMAAAVLAKGRGLTVLSTTRQPEPRRGAARAIGVDHVARRRRRRRRAGARASCPTASTPPSSWSAPPRCPTPCAPPASTASSASPGCSATSGPSQDFYPIDYLPRGVRLTAYCGEAADLPADVLQAFLDAVAAGRLTVPIDRAYDARRDRHRARRHGSRRRRRQARRPPLTDPSDATASTESRNRIDGRSWALLSVTQLMVVLDAGRDRDHRDPFGPDGAAISPPNSSQGIVTAYALAFGSLCCCWAASSVICSGASGPWVTGPRGRRDP